MLTTKASFSSLPELSLSTLDFVLLEALKCLIWWLEPFQAGSLAFELLPCHFQAGGLAFELQPLLAQGPQENQMACVFSFLAFFQAEAGVHWRWVPSPWLSTLGGLQGLSSLHFSYF